MTTHGTVKFFNPKSGFGFIQDNNGKEYFFRKEHLADGVTLKKKNEVTFKTKKANKRGKKDVAYDIELVQENNKQSKPHHAAPATQANSESQNQVKQQNHNHSHGDSISQGNPEFTQASFVDSITTKLKSFLKFLSK